MADQTSTAGTASDYQATSSLFSLAACCGIDIDGEERAVKLHDTTFIPPDVPSRFSKTSTMQPMKILWIYAAPEATRTLTRTAVIDPVALEHK
jgi:hypothetical protein